MKPSCVPKATEKGKRIVGEQQTVSRASQPILASGLLDLETSNNPHPYANLESLCLCRPTKHFDSTGEYTAVIYAIAIL